MSETTVLSSDMLRRQARILTLLHAAKEAGLTPIGIIQVHTFAYLSNVLAPIWNMPALDGKVLKRLGGPFYPALQRDLDRLVGRGIIQISNVTHVQHGPRGRWRLEGRYRLNAAMAENALNFLFSFDEERRVRIFLVEIAYALSALDETELEIAALEDATYSDPGIGQDNVLDFEEWSSENPSVNAARAFDQYMPSGTITTPGEKLHLYVRHIRRQLHAS